MNSRCTGRHRAAFILISLCFILSAIGDVREGVAPTDDVLYPFYAHQILKDGFNIPGGKTIGAHYRQRYPVVVPLGIIYRLTGFNEYTTSAYFILCSLIGIWIFASITGCVFGKDAGLATAFLISIYPPFLRLSARILSEPVTIMLGGFMLLDILKSVNANNDPDRRKDIFPWKYQSVSFALCGVVYGLGISAHLLFSLLAVPAAIFVYFLSGKDLKETLKCFTYVCLGLIIIFLVFQLLTPGIIGDKAVNKLSVSKAAGNVGIIHSIEQKLGAIFAPRVLNYGDFHFFLLGVLGQLFLLDSHYTLFYSLPFTVLFIISALYFYRNRKLLPDAQRRFLTSIFWSIAGLYLTYEFMTCPFIRKLGRYFIFLPLLMMIPAGAFLSRVVNCRAILFGETALLVFLLCKTFEGSIAPGWLYVLSGISVLILLTMLAAYGRSMALPVCIFALLLVSFSGLYGNFVRYDKSFYRVPLMYIKRHAVKPIHLYTTPDIEIRGMAPWWALARFYLGYEQNQLVVRDTMTYKQIASLKKGVVLTKFEALEAKNRSMKKIKTFRGGINLYASKRALNPHPENSKKKTGLVPES